MVNLARNLLRVIDLNLKLNRPDFAFFHGLLNGVKILGISTKSKSSLIYYYKFKKYEQMNTNFTNVFLIS